MADRLAEAGFDGVVDDRRIERVRVIVEDEVRREHTAERLAVSVGRDDFVPSRPEQT